MVKVFVPLPGVAALRPSGTIVTKEQTTDRTIAWLEQTTGTKNENTDDYIRTKELKVYLASVAMEDNINENEIETGTEHDEMNDKADKSISYGMSKEVKKENGKPGPKECKDVDVKEEQESEKNLNNKSDGLPLSSSKRSEISKGTTRHPEVNSRCTSSKSSKSSKTVKSVRFSLPESHIESPRGHLASRGSSICEPFFGVPNGSHGPGCYPHRPGSGWNITSSLGDYSNSSFCSMRNRGAMAAMKQIPGRFFPRPTTLDEKEKSFTGEPEASEGEVSTS